MYSTGIWKKQGHKYMLLNLERLSIVIPFLGFL